MLQVRESRVFEIKKNKAKKIIHTPFEVWPLEDGEDGEHGMCCAEGSGEEERCAAAGSWSCRRGFFAGDPKRLFLCFRVFFLGKPCEAMVKGLEVRF